jgi:hypothetical protein
MFIDILISIPKKDKADILMERIYLEGKPKFYILDYLHSNILFIKILNVNK